MCFNHTDYNFTQKYLKGYGVDQSGPKKNQSRKHLFGNSYVKTWPNSEQRLPWTETQQTS